MISSVLTQLLFIKYKYPNEKAYVYIYLDEINIAHYHSHVASYIRLNKNIKHIKL